MRAYMFGAACLVAATVMAFVYLAAPRTGSDDLRSPTEVMGAFVYHLDRGNFGKVCGLYDQDVRGSSVESCSHGFIFNAGQNMAFFGVDIFDGAELLPGYEEIGETKRVYRIKTRELPPVDVTLEKQDNGRWSVTKVG